MNTSIGLKKVFILICRLQNAYNKYGNDNFTSEVVLDCDPINLELYGKMLIKNYLPEFNIVNSGFTKGEMDRNKDLKFAGNGVVWVRPPPGLQITPISVIFCI